MRNLRRGAAPAPIAGPLSTVAAIRTSRYPALLSGTSDSNEAARGMGSGGAPFAIHVARV